MIRLAVISDTKAVYDLICDMENKELDYAKFEDIYCGYIDNECHYSIIFEENNTVMGCLNLRFEYQLHHVSRIAEIMELVVKDGSRSKGIGKILFDKAAELSREQNCVQMEVSSNQSRTLAHSFYERQGMMKSHYKFTIDLLSSEPKKNSLGNNSY